MMVMWSALYAVFLAGRPVAVDGWCPLRRFELHLQVELERKVIVELLAQCVDRIGFELVEKRRRMPGEGDCPDDGRAVFEKLFVRR